MKLTLSKAEILEMVVNLFPKATVMFLYYCGSVAFGLEDSESDIDVTVILDGFQGNLHLSLGLLDVFAYGRDVFLKKQTFDPSVPLYDRAYVDEVLSSKDTLIYLDERYRTEYEAYKNVDMTKYLGLFLESFVEHYRIRLSLPEPQKSHYHILRVRGILDHIDQGGKYEHVVKEPWATMMREYKANWNKDLGWKYLPILEEQLDFLETYKDKVRMHELG